MNPWALVSCIQQAKMPKYSSLPWHLWELDFVQIIFACLQISLRVGCDYANMVSFRGVGAIVASFVPTECRVGYVGYIQKALEKGYLEHPGLHAVLTICLRFSSVLDGACVSCCLFLSTGSYHDHTSISRPLFLIPGQK